MDNGLTFVRSSYPENEDLNIQRFVEECQKQSINYEVIHWMDLIKGDLPKFKKVYLKAGRNRYYHIHEEYSKKLEELQYQIFPSAQTIHQARKDREVIRMLNSSDLSVYLPPTFISSDYDEINDYINKKQTITQTNHQLIDHPTNQSMGQLPYIVLKSNVGSRGRSVYFIHDILELDKVWSNLGEWEFPLICQEFITNNNFDIRTTILEGEVISQIIRYNPQDYLHNLAIGGMILSVQEAIAKGIGLDRSDIELIKNVSLQIGKEFGYYHYATDFMFDINGNLYWLENNISFDFFRTEKHLNLNIANKIIQWVLSH
ncbi:MAG: ATP-grasp domain-containing protein [Candidatus Kariarchaeaceae archaeon]|jgi:glutathione synthase/RimK-type ligase-like ATP-grasp enzyme